MPTASGRSSRTSSVWVSVLFHKKLGSYAEKAERISELAGRIAARRLEAPEAEERARTAGRLAKADLATEMVREMTELQGTMGGIYARARRPARSRSGRRSAHHYLPVGVEADAPPTKEQLGAAAVTWAAVSLADKLDTLVGMFAAGERPTGVARSVRPAPRGAGARRGCSSTCPS